MVEKIEIIKKLYEGVINCNPEQVSETAMKALELGVDVLEAIENGLILGLKEVGDKFAKGEAFLTELIIAAEAVKVGLNILRPIVPKEREHSELGVVAIGTVQGDIHDIGKNIVASMLEANGFEVHDLGVDVPVDKFVEIVRDLRPDILAMSALLTTTAPLMKNVIDELKIKELRSSVRIMVGGGAVTREFANKIGADAYGVDAIEAVEEAKRLLRKSY
jgi:corrinoid protein of di/trimethylamine methyltransferase